MDAIILAGATNSGALRQVSQEEFEAEIKIAGRPMLDYVLQALRSISSIQRIVVVGPDSLMTPEMKERTSDVAEPGNSWEESLINGLNKLNTEEPVLLVTSDIPLITKEALEDFLTRCQERKGDVYYSFVSKEANERKYPGVQRTYVKLREGVFTGGNLGLIAPRIIRDNFEMFKKAAAMRKKPLQLCSLLGWKCMFKLVCGRLSIHEIEDRVAKIFHFAAIGVASPYPEVGIDVDKPSDLQLAKEVLSKIG
jgi:GTP:adenosylcobinamide-phosphate guanylyltransferase